MTETKKKSFEIYPTKVSQVNQITTTSSVAEASISTKVSNNYHNESQVVAEMIQSHSLAKQKHIAHLLDKLTKK